MYGCGSTEFGQLPYLKFTAGAAGTEPALPHSMDHDGEPSHQTRNEVTVPTRLNLQFLQQQRGNKSAVVSSMVAGSYCSALLTRAPDELPEHRHTCLSDRYLFLFTLALLPAMHVGCLSDRYLFLLTLALLPVLYVGCLFDRYLFLLTLGLLPVLHVGCLF